MSDLLAIGMATYNDYPGVWSVVVPLRVSAGFKGPIIVVDNNPNSADGRDTAGFCREWGVKYVAAPEVIGTSAPRNRIFAEAIGEHAAEFVMVCDPHIHLVPGAVAKLDKYLAENPTTDDLLQGPLIMDGAKGHATHFRDEWGPDAMWGRWSLAWTLAGEYCGEMFDVTAEDGNQGGRAIYWTVGMNPRQITSIGGRNLPITPFYGHQQHLAAAGFRPMCADADDPPFDIPGQGLGLFVARRESWLGFHMKARGFGGEEMTIHEKYREAGRRCLLLPWLGWIHRWRGDKSNPGYPLHGDDRTRNYILAINEFKSDENRKWQLARAANALTRLVGEQRWKDLLANPDKFGSDPPCKNGCGEKVNRSQPAPAADLSGVFEWAKKVPRDLDKHLDSIAALAEKCVHVTAFVKRREWDVAVLAGLARRAGEAIYVSHNRELDPLQEKLAELAGLIEYRRDELDSAAAETIDETDLLILDTVHHAGRLYGELSKFASQVRKYILVRGTGQFGEKAEGVDGPGLLPAMRRYMREHPEWTVIKHTSEQYGYTVISRDSADKPQLPGLLKMGWNYAAAMAKHLAGGSQMATEEIVRLRLDTCGFCAMRTANRCSGCGCFLDEQPSGAAGKAMLASSECPLGFWAAAEAAGSPIIPVVE